MLFWSLTRHQRHGPIAFVKFPLKFSNGKGFYVWDSQANFVLARSDRDAAALYAELKERRILVRYFSEPPRLADCLRISIGTDAETDALLDALEELVA